ncbi:GNAT family N-acetyltransferase [Streptomyces sp. GS7]|uniref:GNAT family N-acetyltransferase n=1 Tax=Streptomyces sp. GS7 TaxID=2692234 RepID=UPI001318C216|nr:GNAT family N-acetyltransferase [Streptomyces sp. GS7]QHC26105.1 GNAT family N-acetyltransferase [Streptomyces sp. GS7]
MDYLIRAVRADEWRRLKELRLAALADPVADVAFNQTLEKASALPDEEWRERARRSAEGREIVTFVGEDGGGRWGGMVTAFVEGGGAGPAVDIVGVYVRPECRGTGLARGLFEAAMEWAWGLSEPVVECVRLWVHEENGRAAGVYRGLGFVASGRTMADPKNAAAREVEMVVRRAA